MGIMDPFAAKHRFFASLSAFSDGEVQLSEEESRHASKVLRQGPGDRIEVVDGEGNAHEVELVDVAPQRVTGRILQTIKDKGEPANELHLCLAGLHQAARWETFLEKAIELGCTRITPLVTQRSQHGRLKDRRLQNIMISALKQSERSRLPQLDEPTALADVLQEPGETRLICHEALSDGTTLQNMIANGLPHGPRRVLIGPEGGFTEDEVQAARTAGWTPVWLGERRLRAETAAMLMASVWSQFDG